MSQNEKFEAVADELLDNVAGGYLQVSKWREYVSVQVAPVLNGLMVNASENDKSIISAVLSIVQSTMIPGAEVAAPIRNLWTRYNTVYRPSLQGETVKKTMDQALYSAKMYIDQNA